MGILQFEKYFCSVSDEYHTIMLKFIVLAALVAVALAGNGCRTHNECGQDECCQMLMASRRRDQGAPGNCIKLQKENETCNKYSTCSCEAGLVCHNDTPDWDWDFSPAVCTKVTAISAAPVGSKRFVT